PAQDLARVEAVRDALGPSGKVRVDANGGWDVDTAVRMVRSLDRFGLEYVEQPCATLEELAEVRRRVDVPVAADESIRRAEDPLRVRAALRVAEACGLPVVVSSAVETSVGLAAGVALAAALPDLPHACGLATGQMLTADVTADPLLPLDGFLPVRPVAVDEESLRAVEVDPAGWRARAEAARAAADEVSGTG
ncbi:enolase C-terminal domain-like protein, partial [Nocardiopsis tropica]|nr:enolase C-terminal domain-like protein [Nocardiopsis tropica]